MDDREWRPVVALTGSAPTPRHSHTGVVYKDKLYVFSGYDGGWGLGWCGAWLLVLEGCCG